MQSMKCTRSEDQLASAMTARPSTDLDRLLGTWCTTNPAEKGIAKLTVSQEDGPPQARIFGFGSPALIDWGNVPIGAVYNKGVASTDPMAFDAVFNLGFMEIQAQANFSLGLLVLACFNTFQDGSRRSHYFSREFFYRKENSPLGKVSTSNGAATAQRMSRLEDDPASTAPVESPDDPTIGQFCGDWVTTNAESRGIANVRIRRNGDGLQVRAFGTSDSAPSDWGTVEAEVFTDYATSSRIRAFRACYDFGFMETHLQAKTEKGVLVVASFNRFKDDSMRSNYFSREFFYRSSTI